MQQNRLTCVSGAPTLEWEMEMKKYIGSEATEPVDLCHWGFHPGVENRNTKVHGIRWNRTC